MDDPIAVARQRTVDALRAMVADLGPAGRAYTERLSNGQGFDVNRYFSVLTHLSMEPGYVLDHAYISRPLVYARKMDEPLCFACGRAWAQKGEWTEVERRLALECGAQGYHYHIKVDDTGDGFFQLVLLVIMGGRFSLFDHRKYNDAAIVCTHAGLEALLAEGDDLGYPIPSYVLEQASGADLAPTVEVDGDQVLVQVAQFTKWGGLSRKTYRIQRALPHRFLDLEGKALVEFNCGYWF